ncbi:hypothetical protein TBK1r_27510 [Stieleria magnilauensis]|uniref:Uncharacterized protein n=1 Tax=Stieleria magnilauensis TaxID=2527963 RepID=A0ABX5XP69_9BACT|nr:hypothetical protein TBK1r_27510 [Planctomycetes bacterium TBK1r]
MPDRSGTSQESLDAIEPPPKSAVSREPTGPYFATKRYAFVSGRARALRSVNYIDAQQSALDTGGTPTQSH